MGMRIAVVIVILVSVPLLGGCRGVSPVSPPQCPTPTELEPTPRKLMSPDVSAVSIVPAASNQPPPLTNYHRLTAEECCTLACQNSTIANLLESGLTVKTGWLATRGGKDAADWVRVVTTRHMSQEARNRNAGNALTIYYKLLEAELKLDILGSALAELEELITANDKLAARGFKQTADAFDLQKQRIELLADQARLRAGVRKGNAELKSLLAIDPNTAGFLLPADQVRVVPDPLDADQAVQLGLMLRSDLNLIRSLSSMLNHQTLVAVRQSLIGIAPALSAVQSTTEFLFPPLTAILTAVAKAEATIVKRQLQGLLRDRERAATKDIRSAADEWLAARDLVAIARKRVELIQSHVVELEKKLKAGFGVELELRKTRLEALKAEGELITEVIRWKVADVKAREEIGLLCGCDSTCK